MIFQSISPKSEVRFIVVVVPKRYCVRFFLDKASVHDIRMMFKSISLKSEVRFTFRGGSIQAPSCALLP